MSEQDKTKNIYEMSKWIALGFIAVFIFIQFFEVNITLKSGEIKKQSPVFTEDLEDVVLPVKGIVLPVVWGDIGKQMIEEGVIDKEKFKALYERRGGLAKEELQLLESENNGKMRMTHENSGVLLNLCWAFGLAKKNRILMEGPMMDLQYGGDASRFASTGGWTLAKGDTMNHYSAHAFVVLTLEQQTLVERVSQGIFRPCCGNSTYFPDCNHGMAMLGLLELLASQGLGEKEMYEVALQANSYWFPSTYLTIAKYFAEQGISWDEVSPKEALSARYSSAQGFQQIRAAVEPLEQQGGPGCGV